MSTGWKYIRDDGEVFKSALYAAQSLLKRPNSTFEFSELSMAGERRRPATADIVALLTRSGTECDGSGDCKATKHIHGCFAEMARYRGEK